MPKTKFARLIRLINYYPPFLFSGIRVTEFGPALSRFTVELRMRPWNRNLFGTHFGGSLYAMCDPFYVFIAAAHFGDEFILWDKSAGIRFLRPAKGTVRADFHIPEEMLRQMEKEVREAGKKTFAFTAEVKNSEGKTVAEVDKEIYIRLKQKTAWTENNLLDFTEKLKVFDLIAEIPDFE